MLPLETTGTWPRQTGFVINAHIFPRSSFGGFSQCRLLVLVVCRGLIHLFEEDRPANKYRYIPITSEITNDFRQFPSLAEPMHSHTKQFVTKEGIGEAIDSRQNLSVRDGISLDNVTYYYQISYAK